MTYEVNREEVIEALLFYRDDKDLPSGVRKLMNDAAELLSQEEKTIDD